MAVIDDEKFRSLKNGSHVRFDVSCDLVVSDRCKSIFTKQVRTIHRDRARNHGKDVCLYCSRQTKHLGRCNPNTKNPNLDDNFFRNIDTENKAYILGFIASDGHVSKNNQISITIHEKDIDILYKMREALNLASPISRYRYKKQAGISLCSKTMVQDVCNHLNIQPGKKSHCVGFPTLASSELSYHFIRGFFDGDGCISHIASRNFKCSISTNSKPFREGIGSFLNKTLTGQPSIWWGGVHALDFLSKLYDGASIFLARKRELYQDWCTYVPELKGSGNRGYLGNKLFRWAKTRKDAVIPSKARASDSGFDLVLLEKIKQIGVLEFYDTGIKVAPADGWYFDLVPRSSIIKSGYILANSVGVIDRSYRGSIRVGLIKIDKDQPDLPLPNRLVQIIPRPVIHFQMVEVSELDDTDRGEGGFGSTGA